MHIAPLSSSGITASTSVSHISNVLTVLYPTTDHGKDSRTQVIAITATNVNSRQQCH